MLFDPSIPFRGRRWRDPSVRVRDSWIRIRFRILFQLLVTVVAVVAVVVVYDDEIPDLKSWRHSAGVGTGVRRSGCHLPAASIPNLSQTLRAGFFQLIFLWLMGRMKKILKSGRNLSPSLKSD